MKAKKPSSPLLDKKIMLSMILVSLGALVVLGFRYNSYTPCTPGEILLTSNPDKAGTRTLYAGEPIRFAANLTKAKSYEWDFGDKASRKLKGRSVVYSFNEPGRYTVTLTINGNCNTYQTLEIAKAREVKNPLLIPRFLCPQTAEVGVPIHFKDSTPNARSWEWRFGETSGIDAVTADPTYTYATSGMKTVTLIINGKLESSGTCKIYVSPTVPKAEDMATKPKGPGPLPKINNAPKTDPLSEQLKELERQQEAQKQKAPSISYPEFEKLLLKVAKEDQPMEVFDAYLCGNFNMIVTFNGKNIPFQQMCKQLVGMKERRIKSIKAVRLEVAEDNCIVSAVVEAKKTTF